MWTTSGNPDLGTLPDFGNFPDEIDRYDAVETLMPQAKAVSAKCYHFDGDNNETKIDFPRMMEIVKATGYSGYVGIEYEGQEMAERDGIKACKDATGAAGMTSPNGGLKVAVVGAGFAGRVVHLPGYEGAGQPVNAICDVAQGRREVDRRAILDSQCLHRLAGDAREGEAGRGECLSAERAPLRDHDGRAGFGSACDL